MNKLIPLKLGILLAAVPALMSISPAFAVTATTTFQVTATVINSCTVTATNLAFGNYNPQTTTATDAISTITPICTLNTPYTVGLNVGTGTGAIVASRVMTSGTNTLTYGLFRDVARALVFGQTIGTDTIAATGTGIAQPITIYGRIPALQNVAAAIYNDTITVSVIY